MTDEVITKTRLNPDGSVDVLRWQDAEDIAERAKMLADQPQFGKDFHHRWSLPAVMVEFFYNKYCGDGNQPDKPMDQNFWEWVHKQMKDPQYSKFWTHNPSNPFFVGYQGNG
jgi:hypothetical protein